MVGDELHCIINLGNNQLDDLRPLLEPLARWRCGTATVDGLAEVPRGVRLARTALRSNAGPGIESIELNWTGAVMSVDEELSAALAKQVLQPLADLKPHEQTPLFETLDALLIHGSIAEIATRTYRHRNTIRARIRTLERITELNLSRPRDLALLALARDWMQGPAGQLTWTKWTTSN